ncbi:putative serine esterase-domain-containing protein [Schizophyllum amplum]|uniref:Putative serine esterase-domain-containing protein n=1 Tax=Schizophyllum amplum TaxID=97359 RepID=A0A550CJ30_9AGAR|nr:putative serine esterase-domain-containing protein [Auriculariopsis ampla]
MSTVHLLVLVHGMWGHIGHLEQMRLVSEAIKPTDGCRLHVLLPTTNSEEHTYDGVDWGGERVAQEILDEVDKLKSKGDKVTKFSVTGYSLGGLISRYAIGILKQKGLFEDITPVNFITVATPHLGLIRYRTTLYTLFAYFGPKLLARTGEQFYCVDKWSATGRSLLEVMADPERIFYQTLQSFQRIAIYANAVSDYTVPYMTAAIDLEDQFADMETNGLQLELDEHYTNAIIKSYRLPDDPPPKQHKMPDARKLATNALLYATIPFLLPIALPYAITRFVRESRSSRARIKLLKTDETLAAILAKLEEGVEGMTVGSATGATPDIPMAADVEMDDKEQMHVVQIPRRTHSPGAVMASSRPASSQGTRASSPTLDSPSLLDTQSSTTPVSSAPTSTSAIVPASNTTSKPLGRARSMSPLPTTARKERKKCRREKAPHPVTTPLQHKMAEQLNELPLVKVRTFFPGAVNAHAVIVCRDVETFSWQKVGQGALRHWADHFVA